MFKYLKKNIMKFLIYLLRRPSAETSKILFKNSKLAYMLDDKQLVYSWKIFSQNIYMKLKRDSYIDKQVLYDPSYSKNVNFHILKNIVPGTMYIDIGANIGTTALPVALTLPDIDVAVFEPNPLVFQQLLENINLNHVQNIKAHNVALGNEEAILNLNIPQSQSSNMGTASLIRNSDIKNPIQKQVQVKTLDCEFASREKRISLIKIDVQGFEWRVLSGAKKTIERDKPVIVFEHEDRYAANPEEVKSKLNDYFLSLDYMVLEIDRYDYRRLRNVKWHDKLNCNLIALPNL